MKTIKIDDQFVGPDYPCFIIAEAGVNHNGDIELAKKMIEVARKAGVNAIKFQTFRAEKVVSPNASKATYQFNNTGIAESQLEMIKKLELTYADFRFLKSYCKEQGLLFLSTPFDEESADFLDSIGMSAFKMASGELTNLPFQAHVARKGKPMIVSTGMSNLFEVEQALNTIRQNGDPDVFLLHCTSNYPAPYESVNLRAMLTLKEKFCTGVGYSDHTQGIEVSVAAVALGACVIEKHFTLDRRLNGPDHKASLEPSELRQLVAAVRHVEVALGNGEKWPSPDEIDTAMVARKSIHVNKDLSIGHVLKDSDLIVLRPGYGISPALMDMVIGKKIKISLKKGSILREEYFEKED